MRENPENPVRSQYTGCICTAHRRLFSGPDESVDDDNNWLISLSDVLSLLLVFFIIFMVITKKSESSREDQSVVEQSPVLRAGEPVMSDHKVGTQIHDDLAYHMHNLDLGEGTSIVATDREFIITIKDRITFSPGEAEILDSFEPVLDNVAAIIRKHPTLGVDIIGHTDNVPIHTSRFPSNWELSVARATSVLKYFIHHHFVDPSRLSVKGNADQKPVAPNNTPEERAQNRRVEIRLKRTDA